MTHIAKKLNIAYNANTKGVDRLFISTGVLLAALHLSSLYPEFQTSVTVAIDVDCIISLKMHNHYSCKQVDKTVIGTDIPT